MGAMVEAQTGELGSAIEGFDRLAGRPDASQDLRLAAELAGGYGRLWSGDDQGARESFDAVVSKNPRGRLADDAEFGSALTQWRSGDPAGAEARFAALAERPELKSTSAVSREGPERGLRAMARASRQRYRRLPVGSLGEQLLASLEFDSTAHAKRMLRRIRAGDRPPNPADHGVRGIRTISSEERRFAASAAGKELAAGTGSAERKAIDDDVWLGWLWILAAVAAISLLVLRSGFAPRSPRRELVAARPDAREANRRWRWT
jgi:hypothetical protein